MIPSSPQSRTIGTGEWSIMPTVVFRLEGQDSIRPRDCDQSWVAISFEAAPPPARKEASWFPPITSSILTACLKKGFHLQCIVTGPTCRSSTGDGRLLPRGGYDCSDRYPLIVEAISFALLP